MGRDSGEFICLQILRGVRCEVWGVRCEVLTGIPDFLEIRPKSTGMGPGNISFSQISDKKLK